MKLKTITLLTILGIMCCFESLSSAQSNYKNVTIEWTIPTKANDIRGYFFSLESESGVKVKSDIGFCRSYTFTVVPGRKYRVSIIPYDSLKAEGKTSNVIEYCHTNTAVIVSLPKPTISISK